MADRRLSVSVGEDVAAALDQAVEDRQTHLAELVRTILTEWVSDNVWHRTVGGLVLKLLKDGKATPAILAEVRSAFPSSAITERTCSWYRARARKADPSIPSEAEARAKASGT